MTYRERTFPDSFQAADRMDLGQIAVDKTKHSVPLGISEVICDGRRFVLVLERFGNSEVRYCRRNRDWKRGQPHPFSVESHLVIRWIVGALTWGIVCPGKVADGVTMYSYGE